MTKFKNILVLAAMVEEERSLAQALSAYPKKEVVLGRGVPARVAEYFVGSREVMVAQSGIGPVNAAVTLAMILEHRTVDAVFLLGVGGSIVPDLAIGDLVVSKKILQHDYFASHEFGSPRMRAGDIIFTADEAKDYVATLEADEALIQMIAEAIPAEHLKFGTVVSGNEFVGTLKRKQELRALHPDAILVEMEAAGVAQVASRVGLPFVVVKTVSDRLHADGTIEADFRACLDAAAKNAAAVLHQILNHGI